MPNFAASGYCGAALKAVHIAYFWPFRIPNQASALTATPNAMMKAETVTCKWLITREVANQEQDPVAHEADASESDDLRVPLPKNLPCLLLAPYL